MTCSRSHSCSWRASLTWCMLTVPGLHCLPTAKFVDLWNVKSGSSPCYTTSGMEGIELVSLSLGFTFFICKVTAFLPVELCGPVSLFVILTDFKNQCGWCAGEGMYPYHLLPPPCTVVVCLVLENCVWLAAPRVLLPLGIGSPGVNKDSTDVFFFPFLLFLDYHLPSLFLGSHWLNIEGNIVMRAFYYLVHPINIY